MSQSAERSVSESLCPVCQGVIAHRDTAEFTTDMAYVPAPPGHRHDPNTKSRIVRCANGHVLMEGQLRACPVDGCQWAETQRPDGPKLTPLPDAVPERRVFASVARAAGFERLAAPVPDRPLRLRAAPDRVLIALLPPPERTEGGIILPTAPTATTRWGACLTGIALEIGCRVHDIAPGDRLLLYPYLNPTPFEDSVPTWQRTEWQEKYALPEGVKILSLSGVIPVIPKKRDGTKRRGFGPPGEILGVWM